MSYAVWGWGGPADEPTAASLAELAPYVAETTGVPVQEPFAPRPLPELPPPRRDLPASLAQLAGTDPEDRARHGIGRSYRDLVRAMRGTPYDVPDLVLRPTSESEVEDVLDWAARVGAPVVPFGGGTSVVGGVEPRIGHGYRGTVSIDLRRLSGIEAIDEVSGSALVRAGTTGPELVDGLRPQGLTLRHFPQSFEFSTLGGWIATRAGGHFATVQTHIDDLVEAVRALTPAGPWESRRLPGSGAGPSPDRMMLGSEGILGVITEAWVEVRPRPTFKASRPVLFPSFAAGVEAARVIAQSRLYPSNCRLLDPLEAATTGAGDGSHAVLILGFESAFAPVDGQLGLAVECAADLGGTPEPEPERTGDEQPDSAAESWRSAFLDAPYLRDSLVALGVISETFETAITWDRFGEFHSRVTEVARRAVAEVCDAPADGEGAPRVMCRFTHVYPSGPAPYFTVLAKARRGSEVRQWDEIKSAVSEAVVSAGGTITHHHAVGRDHRPWYDLQRPDRFADALAAAKRAVDPEAVLNPGVLIDPDRFDPDASL